MVHLSKIPVPSRPKRDATAAKPPQAHLSNAADEFTTSVYGSKFAGQDLPRHAMPEGQMPRDVAYRMIKDELSLDNNPKLKYAALLEDVEGV